MTDASPLEFLGVSEAAADAAAALLCAKHENIRTSGNTRDLNVHMKTSIMDPVTTVDIEAQERIIAVIRKRFPTHRFLAEEDGADSLGDPQSPYVWIIDPIDGTTNFIHGKENFGTIVAVAKDNELLAGCMLLPIMGHRFTASKGHGAYVDGRPVQLRRTASMTDAILCSNITRRAKPDANGVLQVSVPSCASLENYGCAVQGIGDMLLGWNDGVFFRGLKIWDIAAGFLMIAEAGGKYRYEWMEPGNPRNGLLCVGTTMPIFDEVCAFVFEKGLA
ncbi:inositol monophosphatase [Patescibacteria group bacterium]|nr:inositol monophosphatase [Patescibacteria group bacterium]